MSTEPTITCPSCKCEIKLTESLAAPLIEATRLAYEKRLAEKDAETARKQQELQKREAELARAQQSLDEQVAARLKDERTRIAAEEAKKAKLALQTDLEQKNKNLADLEALLKTQNEKLAVAQQAEANFKKKERELDDARREFELTLEKRLAAEQQSIRQKAAKDAEEALKLKVAEKDQTIESMKTEIENLRRKAEQGSQQIQGEVFELELEAHLTASFPHDAVLPVPKGEHGGDVLQRVQTPLGQHCGTILWESKRTKNWSDGWLPKLRDDQRAAKAEIAVLVSHALPKDIQHFDCVDKVWIVHPRVLIPVASAMRQILIEAALARIASDGQQSKMELLYNYMTGPAFRQRVEAIYEAFSTMHEDLEKERKAIMKQWEKRRAQIDRVMQATIGMYGDLQGIAGHSIQEIEGLELKALE